MALARKKIMLKRIYEPPSNSDGTRILVDRLWPRGLTKQEAKIDVWLRDLAPSNELRKWIHAHPERWTEFRGKYFEELQTESAGAAVGQLRTLMRDDKPLTLLFASKNLDQNNATVLKDFVDCAGGSNRKTHSPPKRR